MGANDEPDVHREHLNHRTENFLRSGNRQVLETLRGEDMEDHR